MKKRNHQSRTLVILIFSLALITALLQLSVFDNSNGSLVSSLHNLYLVPILLAAMYLGEKRCIAIALLATVGSGIVGRGFHLPADWESWWSIIIHGAFFVTLGYLASLLAGRLESNSRTWQSLVEISRAINASLDLDETLHTVAHQSVELTSADACAICLLSESGEELTYTKSAGLSDKYLMNGPASIKNITALQQILRDDTLVIQDVRRMKHEERCGELLEEGIIIMMSVPLHIEDKLIGLLNLYRKRNIRFSHRDTGVALAFAEQVAIAIKNARLYASIRKNYLDTVRAFTRAIEAKDTFTLGHSERVAEHAVTIALALTLPTEDIQTIEFGALLHDLGKIGLEDETLVKTGRLSVDEQVMLEMHPLIAKSILEPVEFLRPTIPILLHHHEHWDGSGYPERLAGEAIPLLARIVAVANGFDRIMYHSSPFPLVSEEAIEELRKDAGSVYDAEIVEVFASTLPIKQHGKMDEKATFVRNDQ